MKIALVGAGKTGNKIVEISDNQNEISIFNTKNIPTLENLKGHDVIISFLPGPSFVDYMELFIDSKIPLVTGSTGFDWPSRVDQKLKDNNIPWVYASNFSLGMNLVYKMIKVLSKADELFKDFNFSIHEIHHTKKLDAPSGTALSWEEWSNNKANITHERIGDVVGDHKITLDTPFEKIELRHIAKDRKIFAEGALWAANEAVSGQIPNGLNKFSDIALQRLNN